MKDKVLSVFVDESGDFGQYNPSSPNYYVSMLLHDQEIDISKNINALEKLVNNWGYMEHAIHTGPLIRREGVYKNDLREDRRALFNALYHFARILDINYICVMINQGDCAEKSKLAYTDKLTKEIAKKLRRKYEYFSAFDKIIVYYDYGQIELAQILVSVFNTMFSNLEFRKIETNQYKLSQVADLICTVEAIAQKNVLTKSEIEFFHSKHDFKKNIYKNIVKKKL
ncbi:MAG: DUF3800 domain-containing protein [Lachnospiraceae bacterium]|nr:DUF3800 domain-containing protein [Lachnospiraceae bacterium]